jgi:hypothetical protein
VDKLRPAADTWFTGTATTRTKKTPTKTDLIRAALKATGIKRNAVSVRGNYTSIHCVIKDADVAYKVVSDAAYAHQKIHYCEYSGEILSGGNTYVNVEYHEDVVTAVAQKLLPMLANLKEVGQVVWNDTSANYDEHNDRFNVWQKHDGADYRDHVTMCWTIAEVAGAMATAALKASKAKL